MRKFDELYRNPSEGKECDNLVAIVAHLYNFQVVHSVLIFDILKLLVGSFTEKDIELVLFVLRNVGFALRKDDALALKELISEAQRKASDLGSKFQDQTRVSVTQGSHHRDILSLLAILDNFGVKSCVKLFSGAFHVGNYAGFEEQRYAEDPRL